MTSLSVVDLASRSAGVKKGWTPKSRFHPGGKKGKLHSELGVPESEKIPAGRLAQAEHSRNPEIRRDAIRAKTMGGWHKGPREKTKRQRTLYGND